MEKETASNTKRRIKRLILSKFAGREKLGIPSLLLVMLKSIGEDLDSNDPERVRAGRTDAIKLLPYAIEKEAPAFNMQALQDSNRPILIQLNQYVDKRLERSEVVSSESLESNTSGSETIKRDIVSEEPSSNDKSIPTNDLE